MLMLQLERSIKMISKKKMILLFCIISALTICIIANNFSKKILIDFADIIKNENIEDISLTIYYMSPYILTDVPLTVDDVIDSNSDNVNRIVISGGKLKNYIDLFEQINTDNIVRAKKRSSYVDIRMYYAFESRKNGKLLDVAFWGNNGNILIDGMEIRDNDIFYDIVIPFLPQNKVKEWKDFIENKKLLVR